MEEELRELIGLMENLTPDLARLIKKMYDDLISEGFTEDQAFQYVVANPPTLNQS